MEPKTYHVILIELAKAPKIREKWEEIFPETQRRNAGKMMQDYIKKYWKYHSCISRKTHQPFAVFTPYGKWELSFTHYERLTQFFFSPISTTTINTWKFD